MNKIHTESNTALSPDEAVVKRALEQHLGAEVDNLDFNVTSKLAAARNRALAQEADKPAWQNLFGWQSLTAGVAVMTVAYVIGGQMLSSTSPMPLDVQASNPSSGETATSVLMEDLTILAEGDDIEFYQNIEFLEWLESNS